MRRRRLERRCRSRQPSPRSGCPTSLAPHVGTLSISGSARQVRFRSRNPTPTRVCSGTGRRRDERSGFSYPGSESSMISLPGYEKPDLSSRRPAGLWDAYLRTHGVRALYETVRDEAFVQMPLKHQPYGDWEFEVRDLNGYVLVFGGAA